MHSATKRLRLLSGIKPTGMLHLGNFVGAIAPMIINSHNSNYEVILLCPDWHGLTNKTTLFAPGNYTASVIAAYLALGFNLKDNAIILQSDFPQIQENAWYLACTCNVGFLERSHAYKDAIANGKEATAGLLFYPVLMAADILSFDAQLVPVGKDQIQHLEYARDMTEYFNNAVKQDVYLSPKAILANEIILAGIDGRKMSKSYNNIIPLFASKIELEKAVKAIVTDSKGLDDKKNPDDCLIFQIFKSFASAEAIIYMRERLLNGVGYGYGHAKNDFIEEHERVFGTKRELYQYYLDDQLEVKKLLQEGYERVQVYAQNVISRARLSLKLKSYFNIK